ncbi:MAG TPA: WecB/TagA/CpsF family glycosyltransferase [Microthrixaceae bacterium]|nr:WecB/TagA/CpsF family glycosyltransferase [Microthrixaceae bacterium]
MTPPTSERSEPTSRPSDPDPVALSRVHLFGLDFVDADGPAPVARAVLGRQPADGLFPAVLTPNVDILLQLRRPENADIAEPLRHARYVLADGQPVVWTSRLAGRPLQARVTGSSLFPLVWNDLVEHSRPVVVVAADETTAKGLRTEHPGAEVLVAPPKGAAPADRSRFAAQVSAAVHSSGADHLMMGLSFGVQERIALEVLGLIAAADRARPVVLLLGASFQMHLGLVSRAPKWMQRFGLEWLFRFLREPRRLFHRYFVEGPRFAPMAIREVLMSRRAESSG